MSRAACSADVRLRKAGRSIVAVAVAVQVVHFPEAGALLVNIDPLAATKLHNVRGWRGALRSSCLPVFRPLFFFRC